MFSFRFCGNCSVKIKLKSRYCWNCKSDQVEVGHPSWNSKNTKTVSPDEMSTDSPSRGSFGRPTGESGEIKSPKIMTLEKQVREAANLKFKSKGTRKQRSVKKPKFTLMLQLTLDRKSLSMVKLKPSGEKDFLFQFVEMQHMLRFFKKVLKSGKYSIVTLMVKKIMSCCTKMGVMLSSCLARLKTSSSSKNIRLT